MKFDKGTKNIVGMLPPMVVLRTSISYILIEGAAICQPPAIRPASQPAMRGFIPRFSINIVPVKTNTGRWDLDFSSVAAQFVGVVVFVLLSGGFASTRCQVSVMFCVWQL